uniref:Uncharacterized protein n=1 Tax=Neogobius melanostomus TaxID=47308 RepID=A0A8C6TR00_9GOBI
FIPFLLNFLREQSSQALTHDLRWLILSLILFQVRKAVETNKPNASERRAATLQTKDVFHLDTF